MNNPNYNLSNLALDIYTVNLVDQELKDLKACSCLLSLARDGYRIEFDPALTPCIDTLNLLIDRIEQALPW